MLAAKWYAFIPEILLARNILAISPDLGIRLFRKYPSLITKNESLKEISCNRLFHANPRKPSGIIINIMNTIMLMVEYLLIA
jgi:hypothetical protein